MPTETKFSVWRTIADPYKFLFTNIKPFFALAAIPIALAVGLWIFDIVRRDGSFGVFFAPGGIDAWRYVEALASVLNLSVFAMSWHRYVLLGHRDTAGLLQFRIGRRELRFFIFAFILLFGVDTVLDAPDTIRRQLESMVSGSFQEVVFGALVMAFAAVPIVICALCMRCLLLLPAVAVEGDEQHTVAWTLLRGNTWRLASAMFIASLPLFPFRLILEALFGSLYGSAMPTPLNPWELDIILAIVTYISGFLIVAVAVTVLSMAFRQIADWPPPLPP